MNIKRYLSCGFECISDIRVKTRSFKLKHRRESELHCRAASNTNVRIATLFEEKFCQKKNSQKIKENNYPKSKNKRVF